MRLPPSARGRHSLRRPPRRQAASATAPAVAPAVTCLSPATRPSSSVMIRSPKPNTRGSCVTTTATRSGCTATWRISSMIVCPVWASRAEVGSSQTSKRGSWTSARAMATRCCWPPESCAGSEPSRSPQPHRLRASPAAPGPRRPLRSPLITSGTATFSAAVSAGSRLNCWKTKPTLRARKSPCRASTAGSGPRRAPTPRRWSGRACRPGWRSTSSCRSRSVRPGASARRAAIPGRCRAGRATARSPVP